ncbi:HlyD family type I secretion periplasmic adaptor subunit [Aquamicrobium defluvii]|uniref:Membrane fusion protein (MFP) family protein n=1 Tax=Aquamicrobium defluvii TaxID=69279 RepID=A0A011TCS6_9HYPH|nr:HlyD family type I secretion periplasmic adaptor subunit [Aquamicrobium defluvii]EXL09404.1 secretion protein HlyD [Aquamicrobium defluvii]EZQ12656.1 secretion protein HlyD [Halopseudomonas bauzanensis]TDR36246.1 HlyD family secretion protein [Aquamicrobium defluvii]
MSSTDVAKLHDITWYEEVPRSIAKQSVVGVILLVVCFGGFGIWAGFAPLAAAVIAQGSFVATGQNKIVQHLEGGVIREILVSEGDHVIEGQPLVQLDETSALANERQLFLRRARLDAIVARLTAQSEVKTAIAFPAELTGSAVDPEIAEILASQRLNFEASQRKLNSEIELLNNNISALEFRVGGYEAQQQALTLQIRFLHDEYAGKKQLYEQGLLRKPEISAIQRAMAEADGQSGRLAAEIDETRAQMARYRQQKQQTLAAYRQAALDELQSVEAELDSVREQSRAAENVLRRATINAPVSGTVVRLYYHTAGGVIESGKSIAEILPSDVPLIIEAQIPRTKIDAVRTGQEATVRLTALNQRTTPVLTGTVYYVSADALREQSIQEVREIYLARVRLPPGELARVHGFLPTPGMPAEVLIQTAERTFFDYLSKPIRDSMNRAFRED